MKRNLLFIALIVPGIMILFSTCKKDIGKPIPKPVAVVIDSCTTDIKFAKQIQPILTTYCAINNPLCHASGAPGNFTSYGGFASKSALVVGRLKSTSNPMPPSYSTGPKTLTSCEMSKIESWINAGALNN